MLTALFSYLVTGGLLIGLGVPMWLRRIRPNRWYGFRTPRTLSDERIWYPANRTVGGWMIVLGAALIAVSVTVYLAPVPFLLGVWLQVGVLIVGVLGMFMHGFSVQRRVAEELEIKATSTERTPNP